MARWFLAGSPWSWRRLAVCSLTFLLVFQLYSFFSRVGKEVENIKHLLALHPLPLRELEQVEEMILLPPHGLRYSHQINLNDEFLNSSSLARNIFFPREAMDPRKDLDNNSNYYYPGRIWLDTSGNPIQAHGGGVLFDEKSSTYYWYGEYKNGPTYHANGTGTYRVDVIGVGCYSSKNLWAWKFEGIVLAQYSSSTLASNLRSTNPTATPTRTKPGIIAAILKISATALQVAERAPPLFPVDVFLNELTIFAKDFSVESGSPNETTWFSALSPTNEFNPLMYSTLVLLCDVLLGPTMAATGDTVADAVAIGDLFLEGFVYVYCWWIKRDIVEYVDKEVWRWLVDKKMTLLSG